jgi:hypothetical protein
LIDKSGKSYWGEKNSAKQLFDASRPLKPTPKMVSLAGKEVKVVKKLAQGAEKPVKTDTFKKNVPEKKEAPKKEKTGEVKVAE